MTNEELLQELLNAQKKALLYARIALGLVLCVIIAAACAAPYAIKAVQRAQASLRTIDAISGSVSAFVGDGGGASVAETLEKLNGIDYARLNEAMAKLDGMDLGQLNDAISRLNNVDFNRLNSAMNSLDNVDFTRLNEAIRDLDSLMEPLNRFVKALSPA